MNTSTAIEVREMQRVMRPIIDTHATWLDTNLIQLREKWQDALACHALNRFYKPTNRSPKPLARLKHSLTVRTIQSLHSFKWYV